MQDHILQVVFCSSSKRRIFDWYPSLHSFQICDLLKASDHELLKNWPPIPFQLIRLMKCVIGLKQHRMSYAFFSFKPSLTPCLPGYELFLLLIMVAISVYFCSPTNPQVAYKFNHFVFMPYYVRAINVYFCIFFPSWCSNFNE